MAHPATNGICSSKLSAIAEPITSAISVAIIAASAKTYKHTVNQFGNSRRQTSARFRPVTLPSLIARVCKKMANKLLMRTMKSSEYFVAEPA